MPRNFRPFLSLLIFLAWPLGAVADLTIFDVRRNLPTSDSEPIYRDFIINGGSDSGLAVGMLLNVQRRIPLYDSYQNRSAGDLQLKVARIKIIHVQKALAVARLHAEFTRENAPLLEENYIMVGDHLDLSSASSEKKERAEAAAEREPVAQEHRAPIQPPVASMGQKAPAQIVVNTVDLSSQTAKAPPPLPQKVDAPTLQ